MTDDDQQPPQPNGHRPRLRLALFLLAIAALIAAAWWFIYQIEHDDVPPGLLGLFT